MIGIKQKNIFWNVVLECLIGIHDLDPTVSETKRDDLRSEIEATPKGMISDLFYHNEPFDVACYIAKKELVFEDYRNDYEKIIKNNGW